MAQGQEFRARLNGLIKLGITDRATLAKRLGVSVSTVQRHIPANQKRSGAYTTGRSLRLTSSEIAVIEGGILGDGRLIKNPRGAAFSFSNNKRDLIDWVRIKLDRLVAGNPEARYLQSHPVNHFRSVCSGFRRRPGRTWQFSRVVGTRTQTKKLREGNRGVTFVSKYPMNFA